VLASPADLPPDVFRLLTPEDQRIFEKWAAAELVKVRNNPLDYGPPPHAGQEEVHCSEEPFTLLIAANRFGKTFCMVREALWRATGTHPYKPIRRHRTIWLGFPDYPFYMRVTKPMFDTLVPRDKLLEFHETDKRATIRHADGGTCTIYFLSYDMGRSKWQGASVDFLAFDEEMPEDVFKEGMARVIDANGDVMAGLTPVSGLGWIFDRLYLPLKEGRMRGKLVEGALALRDPSAPCGIGRPLVPHLTREQIVRFAEAIPDEDERAIRIFGQFKARSGGVFKQFRPEIHVVPAFTVPDWWESWGGIDAGYHGFAATLLVMGGDGRMYVVKEHFSQEETARVRLLALAKLVEEVRPKATPDDPFIFYCDTADPQTVLELNTLAVELSLPLVFAQLDQRLKAKAAGVMRVQQLLEPNPARSTPREVQRIRSAAGEPSLYLFDSLHSRWKVGDESTEGSRLAWEMVRYLWKKKAGVVTDEGDSATAHGAHMLDCLRYAIMVRLGLPDAPKEDALDGLAHAERQVWEEFENLRKTLEGG
jgi:phage terminase large subunit-like protein